MTGINTKLAFFGAAQSVTGSRFLLEADGTRILVDCGLFQERQLKVRNWDTFPVPPESIQAILLTHAHLDHCGFIPKLVQGGFRGPVYCTGATAEIAKITLLDSAEIQEEDAEFKRQRHKKENRQVPYPEVPLYTIKDAEAAIPFLKPAAYRKPVAVADGIDATFHEAGHVLGSAMIELSIRRNGEKRKLVFSGDMGGWGKPILHDPTFFHEADYVLIESTYGDRVIEDIGQAADKLAEVINTTVEAGGNIVIPSFALERTQEILYFLNKLLLEKRIPHLMVFVDSPMAVSITDVFSHNSGLFDEEMMEYVQRDKSPFDFPGLTLVRTIDESKSINHIKGSIIIIAGSGMCTGGRIKHHLVTNIGRPESTILFSGYQAEGTLGRQILDRPKEVRILGQTHRVRANIAQISGFSAHADRDGLIKWLSVMKSPRQLFVVHGEAKTMEHFAGTIKDKLSWDANLPRYLDEVMLD